MTRMIISTLLAGFTWSGAIAQTEWTEIPLPANTFAESATPFMQAEHEILVPANSDLEFSISMREGDTIVYAWTADTATPDMLDVEFHGHTEPVDGKGDLVFYKVHNEGRGSGTLKSLFDGGHGWYFNNRSDSDVQVTLSISGFYQEM